MFVFGSSLVDNGNNNFLENSPSRADYIPYGVDFPLGPSGRFSNGKNVIDVLGELLQLPSLIPAFENPMTNGTRIVHGVDYASGGSGILDQTGSAGGVIPLNQQIRNFEEVTLPELRNRLGSASLSKYLFILGTGGNDLLKYFQPISTRRVSLQDFTTTLMQRFSTQIQKLYCLGARKFVLISVYPLGCIPFVKKRTSGTQGCVEPLNQAALLFNSHLKSLVDVLKPKMPGSYLVYVDSYQIIMDILQDPITKGFNDTANACCEVPLLMEGGYGILCTRGGFTCDDRRSHVFYDGLHPTEAVNDILGSKAYTSNLASEVYPINIQQLVEL